MRVLLTTPPIKAQGGVANYYEVLRKYLSGDVTYFDIRLRGEKEPPFGWVRRLIGDCRRLFRVLKDEDDYALVHLSPSLRPMSLPRNGLFCLIAKARRKKVLVFFRGWKPENEKLIRCHFLPIFRFMYFRADAFVVLASHFKETLVEMGYKKPIFLETTIVDDEVFDRISAQLDHGVKKYENNNLNILFLARIEITKGVYIALDAYRILRERNPNLTLTIAGDGSEMAAVRRYATDQHIADVEFPGFVRGEAKHSAFSRADFFFFPSWFEGMPNCVCEAMGYGLPVVTRPAGGIRDFFQNGKMGFVSESHDPEIFVELIERLIKNPKLCSEIGAFNRGYARERFMASKVARRIEEIHRKVLFGEV